MVEFASSSCNNDNEKQTNCPNQEWIYYYTLIGRYLHTASSLSHGVETRPRNDVHTLLLCSESDQQRYHKHEEYKLPQPVGKVSALFVVPDIPST